MRIAVKPLQQISRSSELDSLLNIPSFSQNAVELARNQLKGRQYSRDQLVQLLSLYNAEIGNDQIALDNILKLKQSETFCVITGQQLGFMGGPAYTFLKALSCLRLAKETQTIPVFWLATEDHDIKEIDHTFTLNALGNLVHHNLSFPHDGRFVEDLMMGPKQFESINHFFQSLGWQDLYASQTMSISYSKFMASFLAKFFAGTGLIFIEPYLLRSLAIPFFKREILHAEEISNILKTSSLKLEKLGQNPPLKIEEGTNLFIKDELVRRKIRLTDGKFYIGKRTFTEAELIKMISEYPERFSTNAAARPILQSLLFPTLAYVAGPSEFLYYHQLKDYHSFHDVPMPWIVPRVKGTFIPPYADDLLQRCGLNPWDDIPDHWHDVMPEIGNGVEELAADWKSRAIDYFREDLTEDQLGRYIFQAIKKLQKRLYKSRLSKRKIPFYALHYLKNLLHPRGRPQERVLNWLYFQSQTKENLVEEFLKIKESFIHHQIYCFLSPR